jgi:DNA-binding PadR family transcriptional regulator
MGGSSQAAGQPGGAATTGMFAATELGSLDLQVLLAAIRLGPRAYGKALWAEISRVTGRAVCLSSVYSVLGKLERAGCLTREVGQPGLECGQRGTFCYYLTGRGGEALERSLAAIDALRSKIDVKVCSKATSRD